MKLAIFRYNLQSRELFFPENLLDILGKYLPGIREIEKSGIIIE